MQQPRKRKMLSVFSDILLELICWKRTCWDLGNVLILGREVNCILFIMACVFVITWEQNITYANFLEIKRVYIKLKLETMWHHNYQMLFPLWKDCKQEQKLIEMGWNKYSWPSNYFYTWCNNKSSIGFTSYEIIKANQGVHPPNETSTPEWGEMVCMIRICLELQVRPLVFVWGLFGSAHKWNNGENKSTGMSI